VTTIMGIRHVGLRLVSVALATLLWLAVTGDPAPKTVPVVPSIEGEPAEGFRLGAVSADPVTVEVVGSPDDLDLVTAAVTETVSVDGARAPFTIVVDVATSSPDVRLSAPVRARVVIDIVPVN
jgi:YbbR domain-containing protein